MIPMVVIPVVDLNPHVGAKNPSQNPSPVDAILKNNAGVTSQILHRLLGSSKIIT